MDWEDEALILSARPHAEADAVVSLLTFQHGRHPGLVKGGGGRRARPLLQPGNRVQARWRARLPEHLGTLVLEPVRLYASLLIHEPLRLAAVASATSLLDRCLPERDPHPTLFAAGLHLMGRLASEPDWPEAYIRFELVLLAELGFGLDLSGCAVTGAVEGLAFVSPRTGRAVTAAGAGSYAGRLLPLPCFLAGHAPADPPAIAAALKLTGHFLARSLLDPVDQEIPHGRDRLQELWRREHGLTQDEA